MFFNDLAVKYINLVGYRIYTGSGKRIPRILNQLTAVCYFTGWNLAKYKFNQRHCYATFLQECLISMMNAKLGDDVFQEDPTVKQLEEKPV